MSTDDREIEVYRAPRYMPGDKVVSKRSIKNDGTMAGREIGEVVVKKGDVGYVRDIGVFLQQFYIYSVDFVARANIVGMRERELVPDETNVRVGSALAGETRLQSHIVTRQTLAQKETI
ncbi:nitrogen fixation protein NifZ [Tropicimonas sp. IMCC34043]|uniref:nitrogen fixation protein NifZ n=1 Tax=Tropicimonas sp. IMCC34043 TaxID=2248760 RepID=UPI000E256237|nr:nitrogen fixation protein NifZ [Tropicimonas sp. IMCC34043]